MAENLLRARVEERLKALEINAFEAARRGELNRFFVYEITTGKKRNVQGENLAKLARALECSVAYLTGEEVEPAASQLLQMDLEIRAVPIVGIVEAGTFREVDEFGDVRPRRVSAPRDARYPDARQIAFEVSGDSMDAAQPPIPRGAIVVCVDFDDIEQPLRDGMRVVVERTRDGGHLREWSIKEVRQYEDRVEFIPRSTNPRHKPITVERGNYEHDGTTIRVLALVRMTITLED